MRYLLALLAYLVALVVVAALAFVIVIVLAGPHAGLLPEWAEMVLLVVGWSAVLVVPVWVAILVYKRRSRAS